MINKLYENPSLKNALYENKRAKVLEIIAVFSPAIMIAVLAHLFAGENPIIRQSIIWLANVIMLYLVWLGLKLRDQSWKDIGLHLESINLKSLLLSFVVFVVAVGGFIVGSIVMANIVGIPTQTDMSGYNYIQGNLPMLTLALVAVFIASSFGEEVIYRGFLITRISEIGSGSKKWIWTAVLLSSIIFGLIHFDWG